MAQQIQKICPICGDLQYFEWQVDAADPDLPVEFWLMCCQCGYECDAAKLEDEDGRIY